ncbi:MAG: SDR family NAD(P)-dependent oxidoreductase [Streptosporangiaceae bacterium]
MDFTDEVAVVTGAASGIGRAIATALAGHGAMVVAADRDLAGAEQTAAAHGRVTAVFLDLTSNSSIGAARDAVQDRLGAVTILVNAAGWDRPGPFLETGEQFWRDVVDINYVGHVRVSHAFLPPMIAAGRGGTVVNVASDAGRVGSSGETVYAGAKGGVIAFTKSLAREVARYQITVNCVCPGPTDTPLFQSLPESTREALVRAIPFRRVAQPEEIAAAVLFFASGMARYITGQVLSVSGGLTMAG